MAPPSRRDVLRAGSVGFAALAGCSGRDDSPDATTGTTRTATRTTTRTTETTEEATTEETTTADGRSECAPDALPGEDWPLPDRDPANANYAPSAVGPTEKPSVRWKRKAEQPDVENYVGVRFTDPVVAGDRVFVGKALRPGTERPMPEGNALQAYDRATGERVWAYPMGKAAPKSVAVMGDAVYVTTADALHAVGRRDATRRWTREPAENVVGMLPHGDRIYAVSGLGTVTALRTDGSVAWKTSVGEYARPRPAVRDDTVYVGTGDASLTALRTSDGRRRWSVALKRSESAEVVGDVVVTDCGAFATHHGKVVALDFDGTIRWRAAGGQYSLSTDGRNVYTGTEGGRLRTLSAADGATEWETILGETNSDEADAIYEDPVVTDDAAFVITRSGRLHSFDAAAGTERWRRKFDVPERPGKPIVADETVFVSVGPNLLALA